MKFLLKIFFFSILLFLFYTRISYSQLISDFKVNDDTTNYSQYAAKVGCDAIGNFVVVWYDERINENPRICGQIFNYNAQRLGNNFQISNDLYQALPSLSVRKDGSFGVSWSVIQTKFRLFDKLGTPISNEIIIADSSGSISSIGSDLSGNFVIAWEQYNSSFTKHIYCQLIDSMANPIGNKIKVNDDNINIDHKYPAITVRTDGSFIITWNDTRPPSQPNCDDVYMQMFDKFGNKVGVNDRVNDDTASINLQFVPKISSDTFGNFVIAWNDDRLNNPEVYVQRYLINGSKIGINFRVTQSATIVPKGLSSVDMRDDGAFIIYWTQFHNFIGQPYFQRFNQHGGFIGNNFLVTLYFPDLEKFSSDITILKNKIISVWTDARNGPFDVYCNIRSFTNPDTTVNIIQTSITIPDKFELYQNYPNPFNSSTIIKFDLLKNDIYKLELYNNLGQKIQTIFDKYLNSGSYDTYLAMKSLSAGVYFYSLSSKRERSVRKLILIK